MSLFNQIYNSNDDDYIIKYLAEKGKLTNISQAPSSFSGEIFTGWDIDYNTYSYFHTGTNPIYDFKISRENGAIKLLYTLNLKMIKSLTYYAPMQWLGNVYKDDSLGNSYFACRAYDPCYVRTYDKIRTTLTHEYNLPFTGYWKPFGEQGVYLTNMPTDLCEKESSIYHNLYWTHHLDTTDLDDGFNVDKVLRNYYQDGYLSNTSIPS